MAADGGDSTLAAVQRVLKDLQPQGRHFSASFTQRDGGVVCRSVVRRDHKRVLAGAEGFQATAD